MEAKPLWRSWCLDPKSSRRALEDLTEAKPLWRFWVSGPKSQSSRRGSRKLDCGDKAFVAVLGVWTQSQSSRRGSGRLHCRGKAFCGSLGSLGSQLGLGPGLYGLAVEAKRRARRHGNQAKQQPCFWGPWPRVWCPCSGVRRSRRHAFRKVRQCGRLHGFRCARQRRRGVASGGAADAAPPFGGVLSG